MMIDLGKLLKRSWQVLWNYRTLWIFAILLALTAVGGGNSVINFNIGEAPERPFFQPDMEPRHPRVREVLEWIEQNVLPVLEHPEEHISTIIWIVVITVLFLLVIGAALTVVRYVAETAVIRMVDQHEANGEKVGFKAGWRLGWSRRAFHIWVIDLIIGLPVFIFIMLAAASLVLLILSINAGVRTAVAVSIAALGCVFLFIFLLSLVLLFLTLLRNVWVRVAGLEGAGIRAAFRQGWSLFKRNWKSFGLVWLVILGIRIGFSLVSLVLFFLLIPLYFLLAIPAAILSLILGLILFSILSIFVPSLLAGIVAAVLVTPFFLIITLSPLIFLTGMFLVYESIVWTLTYREVQAAEELLSPAIQGEIGNVEA